MMQNQVIEPAVKGTRNVMEACAEIGVKRVVFTSSIGAVYMDPRRDPLAIVDDDCWSDLDYCIHTNVFITFALTTHVNINYMQILVESHGLILFLGVAHYTTGIVMQRPWQRNLHGRLLREGI